MTATRLAALALVVGLVAGCSLPSRKDVDDTGKAAASPGEAARVVRAYDTARAEADGSGDPSALEMVQADGLLAIERNAFAIRRKLGVATPSAQLDPGGSLLAPRLAAYPLWFVLLSSTRAGDQQVAAVFTRRSTTERWLLTLGPRLALTTEVPEVARDSRGAAAAVHPEDPTGLPASPRALLERYAEVLADPRSRHVDTFAVDSFIAQVRSHVEAQPGRGPVAFRQSWSAAPEVYALRTEDGGALVLGTLRRVDSYRVTGRQALSFEGSEAGVLLPAPVRRRAELTYRHQVLMSVPAEGAALVIGQYGGLVAASGR